MSFYLSANQNGYFGYCISNTWNKYFVLSLEFWGASGETQKWLCQRQDRGITVSPRLYFALCLSLQQLTSTHPLRVDFPYLVSPPTYNQCCYEFFNLDKWTPKINHHSSLPKINNFYLSLCSTFPRDHSTYSKFPCLGFLKPEITVMHHHDEFPFFFRSDLLLFSVVIILIINFISERYSMCEHLWVTKGCFDSYIHRIMVN